MQTAIIDSSVRAATTQRSREAATEGVHTHATSEIIRRYRSVLAKDVSDIYRDLHDRPGAPSVAERWLDALSAEEVAESILWVAVNKVGRVTSGRNGGISLQTFCRALAGHLGYRGRVAYLDATTETAKDRAKDQRTLDRRSHAKFKREALARIRPDLTVDTDTMVSLCLILVEAARRNGVVEILEIGRRGVRDGDRVVVLADRFAETLANLDRLENYLYPLFTPMMTAPAPWTSPTTGPYTGTPFSHVGFVKAGFSLDGVVEATVDGAVNAAGKSGDLWPLMRAANIMQSTKWRVNQDIADVVRWAVANHAVVGKLRFEKAAVLDKLPREDWAQMADDEKASWKALRAQTTERNRRAASDRSYINTVLGQVEQVGTWPFWLPVQVDYRGRLYYLPSLNPQGPDWVKALLEFNDAKPIGEEGMYWLAAHLANEGDFGKVSKKTFDERVAWVHDNVDAINDVADNPYENLWWTEADKPFSFLAACMSYCSVLRNGPDTPVHTPVAFDGSNSGVQHYSAALRDPQAGKSVNLLPGAVVEDIYEDVAAKVRPLAEARTCEHAAFWAERGIKRADVKRSVMTYCYSSTLFRWAKNILRESLGVDASRPSSQTDRERASWLAKAIMTAVKGQLRSAYEGMEWLKVIAGLYADAGLPMSWVSPIGLPVTIKRTVPTKKRFDTYRRQNYQRFGTMPRMTMTVLVEGAELDKRAMQQSVGANFIHSLDASHAAMVMLHGHDQYGINDYAMIHDSFGTTPAEAGALYRAIRESFVQMYTSTDPFMDVYAQARLDLGDNVPLPPPRGTLDIEGVLSSPYCFA